MTTLKSHFVPVLLFVFMLMVTVPRLATADIITFEVSGVGSGTLGGVPFNNELVTITGVGDTNNVEFTGTTHRLVIGLVASIEISSIGTAQFVDSIGVVSNHNALLGGFGNFSSGLGLFFVSNPTFATYDLTTSVGPLMGQSFVNPNFAVHNTSLGVLGFSSMGTGTFIATTMAIPEPGAAVALAVAGLVAVGRRGMKR